MRLFVDNLTNVDFSYLCPQRGLVGETWLASIALDGSQDEQGMICDFGRVKQHLRYWLDEQVDHKLLIPTQAPQLTLQEDGQTINCQWHFGDAKYLSSNSPREAVCLVTSPEITPERLAVWCIDQLNGDFGAGVDNIHLTFAPETSAEPFYHYSHGLKKHQGNCQRIAHGHRSKIMIWRNGVLCPQTMAEIADQWRDIYLGTRSDLRKEHNGQLMFAYEAQQGHFDLQLPASCCYLMDEDTTVENISAHLAQRLKLQYPQDVFEVKAFEGIAKGAISRSA